MNIAGSDYNDLYSYNIIRYEWKSGTTENVTSTYVYDTRRILHIESSASTRTLLQVNIFHIFYNLMVFTTYILLKKTFDDLC